MCVCVCVCVCVCSLATSLCVIDSAKVNFRPFILHAYASIYLQITETQSFQSYKLIFLISASVNVVTTSSLHRSNATSNVTRMRSSSLNKDSLEAKELDRLLDDLLGSGNGTNKPVTTKSIQGVGSVSQSTTGDQHLLQPITATGTEAEYVTSPSSNVAFFQSQLMTNRDQHRESLEPKEHTQQSQPSDLTEREMQLLEELRITQEQLDQLQKTSSTFPADSSHQHQLQSDKHGQTQNHYSQEAQSRQISDEDYRQHRYTLKNSQFDDVTGKIEDWKTDTSTNKRCLSVGRARFFYF